MKFANLISDDKQLKNIGEDMQIFAIENLYYYMGIDYDKVARISMTKLREYKGEKLILPWNFPFFGTFSFSSDIIPVFLGISILSGSVDDYLNLKKYEPVGCRDYHSYKELSRKGIQAYLSGCMSAALPLRSNTIKGSKTFIVDIPDSLRPYIPADLLINSEYLTHVFFEQNIDEKATRKIYDRYKTEAKLVITSRLHCAIPCMAAGIPVIFACEKKSFRYTWVEKYLPIYEAGQYDTINWSPEPVHYEDIKKLLLESAAHRVWNAYSKWSEVPAIHSLYSENVDDNYEIESMHHVKNYVREHWSTGQINNYIIWGITQTADLIYDYLTRHYPKARLTHVIDLYHSQEFHGIKTETTDILKTEQNAVLFVTPESANKTAIDICKKYGHKKYVICWKR